MKLRIVLFALSARIYSDLDLIQNILSLHAAASGVRYHWSRFSGNQPFKI